MKNLIALAVALFSLSAFAAQNGFVPGTYDGAGRILENGKLGNYTVTRVVTEDSIKSTYRFNGVAKEFTMAVQFKPTGEFAVMEGGKQVGEGSCIRHVCSYRATCSESGGEYSESITFHGSSLTAWGSGASKAGVMTWNEKLKRQ